MMNSCVEDVVRAYEEKRSAEMLAGLESCEAQKYGEIPIIEEAEPSRPWEEKPGTAAAIRNWRESFPCLRIRGYALFPEEPIRYDDEVSEEEEVDKPWVESDSDDGRVNFWNDSCEVDPFDNDAEEGSDCYEIPFENDALDESKVFPAKKKIVVEENDVFESAPHLEVVGVRPAYRDYLLPEEDEGEIIIADGECPDFIAFSKWNQTPPPDPDREFPEPVIDPPRIPKHLQPLNSDDYREINKAVMILESYAKPWAPATRKDDPLNGIVPDEFEGFDDTLYDDDTMTPDMLYQQLKKVGFTVDHNYNPIHYDDDDFDDDDLDDDLRRQFNDIMRQEGESQIIGGSA